jgi:hypothetical protein
MDVLVSNEKSRTYPGLWLREPGSPFTTLRAGEGVIGTRSRALHARRDVDLLLRSTGQRIHSDEVHFNSRLDRIWSEGHTRLHQNGQTYNLREFTSGFFQPGNDPHANPAR